MILIEGNGLKIDESSLTGESDSVNKKTYEECLDELTNKKNKEPSSNLLFCGTNVVEGNGSAIIIATGEHSQKGIIKGTIDNAQEENKTPLENKLNIIADFIGYKYPLFYILECKSIKGNTFPLSNLTQYDKLISYSGHEGIRVGVVLWMIDHDTVFYIPVSTFKKLKEDNKKSFSIKYKGEDDYPHIIIPSVKKRTFLHSDYSCLLELPEGF